MVMINTTTSRYYYVYLRKLMRIKVGINVLTCNFFVFLNILRVAFSS